MPRPCGLLKRLAPKLMTNLPLGSNFSIGLSGELAHEAAPQRFDHSPTQRADSLLGHGDAPVLSEVVETPRSQDRTPRPAIPLAVPLAAALLPRERFSPIARPGRLLHRSNP